MSHNEGQNTLTGRTQKQEVSAKLAGYAEGVVHGREEAARSVSDATNGLFTLQEPSNITAYRERLKRYKMEQES